MHFIVVLLLVRSHNGSARVWFQPSLFKSVFSERAHSCLHHRRSGADHILQRGGGTVDEFLDKISE